MSDRIDEYLAGLRRALPKHLRRRVMAEVEDHLRESASVSGAEEAVTRFGSAGELARLFATRVTLRDVRRGTLLLLLALLPLAVAAVPLPQDLLPAWGAASLDRWPTRPLAVAWQQDAILIVLLASGALVLCGIVAGALRRVRLALVLHAGALLSVVCLGVLLTTLAVRWEGALAAAPSLAWISVYALVAATALLAAAWVGFRPLAARLSGVKLIGLPRGR